LNELLEAGTELWPDSAEIPVAGTGYWVIRDEEASSEEWSEDEPEDDEGNENGADDSGEENGRDDEGQDELDEDFGEAGID
jgi:hypothetical protein